jgi:hypothetical protein
MNHSAFGADLLTSHAVSLHSRLALALVLSIASVGCPLLFFLVLRAGICPCSESPFPFRVRALRLCASELLALSLIPVYRVLPYCDEAHRPCSVRSLDEEGWSRILSRLSAFDIAGDDGFYATASVRDRGIHISELPPATNKSFEMALSIVWERD